ncbi:hypothetical protein MKW94_023810 [Papaver nudicaule]|uniref:Uncharacterized protein n=1 Tax=Papaver nudicaule TaxID=74823 RepID=A0AA41VN33_PAPNU|nr:hypothetical protein [Papaver nudicaule]
MIDRVRLTILSRFPIKSFLKLSLVFCLRILDSSTNNSHSSTKLATGDDNNQVSVVFDPSEVPSFGDLEEEEEEEEENKGDDGSEESSSAHDHHGVKNKRKESIDSSNTALNVQPMKSFNPFDDGSFYEILTFWKKREGEKV